MSLKAVKHSTNRTSQPGKHFSGGLILGQKGLNSRKHIAGNRNMDLPQQHIAVPRIVTEIHIILFESFNTIYRMGLPLTECLVIECGAGPIAKRQGLKLEIDTISMNVILMLADNMGTIHPYNAMHSKREIKRSKIFTREKRTHLR